MSMSLGQRRGRIVTPVDLERSVLPDNHIFDDFFLEHLLQILFDQGKLVLRAHGIGHCAFPLRQSRLSKKEIEDENAVALHTVTEYS